MTPKKWKNGPQKLLIIGPDPFISKSSPDHSPQPRIDFSYYEISGLDICSLFCDIITSVHNIHNKLCIWENICLEKSIVVCGKKIPTPMHQVIFRLRVSCASAAQPDMPMFFRCRCHLVVLLSCLGFRANKGHSTVILSAQLWG